MPTFNDPAADAQEAADALRGLAHATRVIDDRSDIYAVLGSVSAGLHSLHQALHQLGRFHDAPRRAQVPSGAAGRAASSRVSSELHRGAELLLQVAAGLDRAHEVEATIVNAPRNPPLVALPAVEPGRQGPSL
jgi:hypothetical protein